VSTISFLHLRSAGLGAGFIIALCAGAGAAEEAPRSQGTKIIFSAPKSDTVSSNLSELRDPALPFRKLESGLQKPFEVFDPVGRGDVRPARAPVPAPQPMPKRTIKEQMNDRAEEMFLNPELFENSKDDKELFGLTEEDVDPYKSKPRNALDRYQDRMERDRPGLTNNSSRTTDLFSEQMDTLDRNDSWRLGLKPLNPAEEAAPTGSPPARRDAYANTTDQEWNTAGRTVPRAFDSGYSGNPDSFQTRARSNPIENRRDGFQRLLQDPGYARSGASAGAANPNSGANNPYLNPYQTTPTPRPSLAPTPSWNTRPVAVSGAGGTADSFSKTVGLVGEPVQPKPMPEYTVSATFKDLNSAPAPQPAPAITTPKRPAKFQIPQRTY
jgi:hypothetical protein